MAIARRRVDEVVRNRPVKAYAGGVTRGPRMGESGSRSSSGKSALVSLPNLILHQIEHAEE
jgi:hypothetical protein